MTDSNANFRSREVKERDLEVIAALYASGFTQREIAAKLTADYYAAKGQSVSRSQVKEDVRKIRKSLWRKAARQSLQRHKERILASYQRIYAQAMESYHKSSGRHVISTLKTTSGDNGNSNVETIRNEVREGDPRYLQIALNALDKMAVLLGLYNADSDQGNAERKWKITEVVRKEVDTGSGV